MSPRSFTSRFALLVAALVASLTFAAAASASTFLVVEAPFPGSSSIRADLLAQPGVTAADVFDASSATPTLAQLQGYDGVITYSDSPYADAVGLGDVLADYVDGGGYLTVTTFALNPAADIGIDGRLLSGGYLPFDQGAQEGSNSVSMGTFDAASPLMQGVTTLTTDYRDQAVLASGATLAASYTDSVPLVASKGSVLGINAYLGDGYYSGDFAKVIVNGLGLGATPATPAAPASGGSVDSGLAPVVTGLSVASGGPGTVVGIAGDHFERALAVYFGTKPAEFVVDGYQHISAIAPEGVSGPADVRVVNAHDASAVTAADRFTYPVAPGSTPPAGQNTPTTKPKSGSAKKHKKHSRHKKHKNARH